MEDGGEDFETGDDLFDAIGGMLLEVDDRREDDIREICEKMLAVMRRCEFTFTVCLNKTFLHLFDQFL